MSEEGVPELKTLVNAYNLPSLCFYYLVKELGTAELCSILKYVLEV